MSRWPRGRRAQRRQIYWIAVIHRYQVHIIETGNDSYRFKQPTENEKKKGKTLIPSVQRCVLLICGFIRRGRAMNLYCCSEKLAQRIAQGLKWQFT
jgi:hypothetical protein